jgi:hypothetical protein
VDAQVKQLRAAGAEKNYKETASGARSDRAKANGVKMGRKPKLTPHQTKEAIRRRDKGEETLVEIGRSYNGSGWTIGRV